jgi:hypothetical protein
MFARIALPRQSFRQGLDRGRIGKNADFPTRQRSTALSPARLRISPGSAGVPLTVDNETGRRDAGAPRRGLRVDIDVYGSRAFDSLFFSPAESMAESMLGMGSAQFHFFPESSWNAGFRLALHPERHSHFQSVS